MTIPYAPKPVFATTITLPKDGDAANEDAFIGITELADRTQQLKGRDDAQDATLAGHTSSLAGTAYKDQANTFTQPQTITGADGNNTSLNVSHEISADSHIGTQHGSFYAQGTGGSIHLNADVDAGNNVLAGVNVQVDTGDFKYKSAKTRTTFVPIFSGWGSAVINGGSGNQGVRAAYNLKFLAANAEHVFPIVLPQGAVLTAFDVLVWKGNSATMYAELNKRTNHNFEKVNPLSGHTLDQTSLTKPQDGASLQETRVIAGTCNVTFDNRAQDAVNGSEYLLSVIAGNAGDEVHAIRLTWTDPGPRNF